MFEVLKWFVWLLFEEDDDEDEDLFEWMKGSWKELMLYKGGFFIFGVVRFG